MAGRLGLDFGTSNTVLASWDPDRRDALPLHVPDLGQVLPPPHGAAVIPSLIHYASGHQRWLGQQVVERDLLASERTFSLMKRYISHRSPVSRRLDGRAISFSEAGRDFLSAVLLYARQELGAAEEDIAVTAPVEAFEHYTEWLGKVAEDAGLRQLRFIDEPSAAALGYGAHIQPGQAYLIFDFGGGTLDVSVALIEEQEQRGRRCRILGKAGCDLGGSTVDQWLFADALKQAGLNDLDEEVRRLSSLLLLECRKAKEQLSSHDSARVQIEPLKLDVAFTKARLEQILDEQDAYAQMDRAIRRALNSSRERGYGEDQIQAVFMVGGSSLIPSVERTVQRIFGREKVRLDRPMDAVARGAAAFAAGNDFYDHIQHDYAIRWTNPQTGGYDYKVIVKKGTIYPTPDPVARLTIKATHAGQAAMGIAIFEMGETSGTPAAALELIFDPAGAARMAKLTPEEHERRTRFWVNETCPFFLKADPPGIKGEPRFHVEFGVDANKRLTITARDLKSGAAVYRNAPVIKLR